MNNKIEITITNQAGDPITRSFEKNTITIGKNTDCDIVLNCNRVSKKHARIEKHGHEWILKDLNSTNGITIDGQKIREHRLKHGNRCSINGYDLHVHFPLSINRSAKEAGGFLSGSKAQPEATCGIGRAMPLKEPPASIPILGNPKLDGYLNDPTISEIMINGLKSFYIEKDGQLFSLPPIIQDLNSLQTIMDRILLPLGRRVDEASPMVDARLSDGSRIHMIIPPIALHGPVLTIRKFLPSVYSLEDLIQKKSISASETDILKRLIAQRKNILISGGTSTGKTTLLNILCQSISPHERMIVIEDSSELNLRQPHTIYLESRPANIEGRGEIAMQQLVQNALRMRPDRIIIGECRGKEAFDMVNAMNTGHEGCLTTCHANSPRDALKRLETMILMAQFDLPIKCIRELIVSAIDVVIQMERDSSGHRYLSHIAQITGMEGDSILLLDIFNSTQGGNHDTRNPRYELQSP